MLIFFIGCQRCSLDSMAKQCQWHIMSLTLVEK
jgi:hypothetical protein